MLVVIDVGNTRTKWAQVAEDGGLAAVKVTSNARLATSLLQETLSAANKVIIANVAGDAIAAEITEMMPQSAEIVFATVKAEAHNVSCQYDTAGLGIDRWTAVVAAWQQCKQPMIVINAGTAITVDSVSREKNTKKGTYLGGSIMPGFQLMYHALAENTAKLPPVSTGQFSQFPDNTQDAIHSGCTNAVVGAVVLQLKRLEKHCAFLPKVVISGGDAVKIAESLSPHVRRVLVVENLVLQGLALLKDAEV